MIYNYRSKKKSLMLALTEIQAFEEKMDVFIGKYPHYSYDLKISKEKTKKPLWIVDLKITRNEQKNNRDTA